MCKTEIGFQDACDSVVLVGPFFRLRSPIGKHINADEDNRIMGELNNNSCSEVGMKKNQISVM
jgi:hypothetical protein